jgi:hypothetical protein
MLRTPLGATTRAAAAGSASSPDTEALCSSGASMST